MIELSNTPSTIQWNLSSISEFILACLVGWPWLLTFGHSTCTKRGKEAYKVIFRPPWQATENMWDQKNKRVKKKRKYFKTSSKIISFLTNVSLFHETLFSAKLSVYLILFPSYHGNMNTSPSAPSPPPSLHLKCTSSLPLALVIYTLNPKEC